MEAAKHKKVKAFTLVELLVVIAIIALLLAILMPALNRVRDQAKAVVCSTRLKDIGLAFNLYSYAYENKLPPSRFSEDGGTTYSRWPTKIAPYYPNAKKALEEGKGGAVAGLYLPMFHCTTQEKEYKGDAPGVYGYNIFFSDYDGKKRYNWRRQSDIRQPSEFPLLACTNGGVLDTVNPNSANIITGGGGGLILFPYGPHPLAQKYGFIKQQPLSKLDVGGPAPNHNGKCNFVFGDFHVEGRNICSKDNWPWFNKTDGTAFHPKGDVSINAPR